VIQSNFPAPAWLELKRLHHNPGGSYKNRQRMRNAGKRRRKFEELHRRVLQKEQRRNNSKDCEKAWGPDRQVKHAAASITLNPTI
jgi:hypothetical protein